MSHVDDHAGQTPEGTRRDFLYYATAGAGAVAAGAAKLDPGQPDEPLGRCSGTVLDPCRLVRAWVLGTQLTVKWRGKAVFHPPPHPRGNRGRPRRVAG